VSVIANVGRIQEEDTGILVEAYHTSVWPVLFWIAVVVFAPIFEEPFARGFLFEGFRHSRMGLAGAVILTSLVWTALHVGYSLFSLGAIFGFGIVLGFVRYRTGSLWSTVLMHGFYNAIGMFLIALNVT
jgi:membrane protease YdiL (CAAX protease family)